MPPLAFRTPTPELDYRYVLLTNFHCAVFYMFLTYLIKNRIVCSSKNTAFRWTVEKVSKRLEAKAERIISQKPIKIRREEKSDKTGLDKQRE